MSTVLHGVHPGLEAEADRILMEHLRTIRRFADKADILTKDKLRKRKQREIYVPSGTPDEATRIGIFHRCANSAAPHLNSRDGSVRGRRDIPSEDPITPSIDYYEVT